MAVGTLDLFAGFGPPAQAKFLLLGSTDFRCEDLMDRTRSLNLEHVSPTLVPRVGISRRPAGAVADEASVLARMRQWYFARKPDAGFVLRDFPATLLQAKVFDEWLETRAESLRAVFAGPGAPGAVVEHYRELGLLFEAGARTVA
jgi:adenylate kinase